MLLYCVVVEVRSGGDSGCRARYLILFFFPGFAICNGGTSSKKTQDQGHLSLTIYNRICPLT